MSRGGARQGAGRPKGQGKYSEPTQAIRLPRSVIESLQKFPDYCLKLPVFLSKVPAGAPAAAEDYCDETLDLNDLIRHPADMFYVRATGDSMINAGIHDNDLLLVDRSITPAAGKIVIAAIDGELTVKRLQQKKNDSYILMPENPKYSPIEVSAESNAVLWGVVTYVIHSV